VPKVKSGLNKKVKKIKEKRQNKGIKAHRHIGTKAQSGGTWQSVLVSWKRGRPETVDRKQEVEKRKK
jgi:hypothetical protein